MRDLRSERGAAAVEFAIVLPILLLLVLGIAEFGRAWQVRATLEAAARDGARVMALQNDQPAAIQAIHDASGLNPGVSFSQVCGSSANAGVDVTYHLDSLTGFFGSGFNLTAKGVMRCHG